MDNAEVPTPKLRGTKWAQKTHALTLRAQGLTLAESASISGCSPRSVSRAAGESGDWLETAKVDAQRKVLAALGRVLDARINDASNQESRTGVGSACWLTQDILGWNGRSLNVHVGDNVQSLVLIGADAASAAHDPAAAAALRRSLGMD